jgi:DHA3 family macrolide efflux protein-like MFS transporter
MASAAQPASSLRAILQQPDFRKLWLAQFVSVFGDFLVLFGVISLIAFRWHGNAVQVTFVMVAYMLPLVGPLAGVFVDRWNVKRVMIASDLTRAALVLLAVVATDVRQICAIFAALGTFSSFFAPAQSVTLFIAAAAALAVITLIGYTRRGEAPQQVAAETEG